MEYKTYMNKIIASGDEHKIDELADYMEYIIDMVGDREKEKVETRLYEIAEGKVLNEDIAHEIIEHMKPAGMKWTLEDTEGVRANMGEQAADIRPVDFWVVMNSAYNDYYDLFNDNIDYYAKYTKDFIKDEDAIEHKVYCYFMTIPKR